MTIKSGLSAKTPERIFVDAGAVYINYGLSTQELLGATRGGNEFNLNREIRDIEVDGVRGSVKGLRRRTVCRPQITCNLIELSLGNLIKAIAGANQAASDRQVIIEGEYVGPGDDKAIKELDHNSIVENSEKVFLDGVLQTRSKKYNSRFVGDNAADNKNFVEDTGDWAKGHENDAIELEANGYSGNCMKFTAGDDVEITKFLNLPGGNGAQLTNLVKGQYYKLRVALKRGAAFTPTITIACDDGNKPLIAPTTSWVVHVIEFIAGGTDASISLTGSAAPTADEVLYVSYLELERVDGAYVMNWETGEIVFAEVDIPVAGEHITASYTYAMKKTLTDVEFSQSGTTDDVLGTYVGHGLVTGTVITVSGCTNAYANAVWRITVISADTFTLDTASWTLFTGVDVTGDVVVEVTHDVITGGDIEDEDYIDNVALVGTISGKARDVICIVKNALADAGFSLATAPRDEAVPAIVFTGHYDPADPETEPWEVRYPRA